jgi:hypothetical protein
MIGSAVAILLWWQWLTQGMNGKAEDSLATLQGILAVGILVGGSFGLLYGLIRATASVHPSSDRGQ